MPENDDNIKQLLSKLDLLLDKQRDLSWDISQLRNEINAVRDEKIKKTPEEAPAEPALHKPSDLNMPATRVVAETKVTTPKAKSDLEKFIGENLINKIGIVITIIGVGIGVKYSIDHELISPVARVILGYLFAGGLLFFGLRLRKNYLNYSAVLVGGAMTIFYFLTYIAFDFYEIIPRTAAFIIMLMITAGAIWAAVSFNRQVIAQLGLVGAYAIPFLLSDGSGKVAVLFTYMAIINLGVLIIAFKKYWKALHYSAFVLTWLIFSGWLVFSYEAPLQTNLAWIFLSSFYIIFYGTFLAYKLLRKEMYDHGDVVLLLGNAFIFYGFGNSLLTDLPYTQNLQGAFAVLNALIHFVISRVILSQKLADRNLFYMVGGLALIFITIAIPVQLDGNWVTLLWTCEATLLFWIGRSRVVRLYERISYPLMMLAFISLVHDWYDNYQLSVYNNGVNTIPVFNITFLTSLVFVAGFIIINYFNKHNTVYDKEKRAAFMFDMKKIVLPGVLLFVSYATFWVEISNYFYQQISPGIGYPVLSNITAMKDLWLLVYTMFFFAVLSFLNLGYLKSKGLALVNIILNFLILTGALTLGVNILHQLAETYILKDASSQFPGPLNIYVRYIYFACAGVLLFAQYRYTRAGLIQRSDFPLSSAFEILFAFSSLVFMSSELIHWLELMKIQGANRLSLSILWGVFAGLLFIPGILKKKKHLRVAAIVLFSVTLIKLFFYDLNQLETIAKTIVFVVLGVILLVISFLYNKYKHFISDEIKAG